MNSEIGSEGTPLSADVTQKTRPIPRKGRHNHRTRKKTESDLTVMWFCHTLIVLLDTQPDYNTSRILFACFLLKTLSFKDRFLNLRV